MRFMEGGSYLLRMDSGMAVGVRDTDPLLCEFCCVIRDGWEFGVGADLLYRISDVTNDAVTFTTSLAARAVNWTDVAGSYDMDFGHKLPVPQPHRLKRGLLEGSDTSSFNIKAGTPGLRRNIYTDQE